VLLKIGAVYVHVKTGKKYKLTAIAKDSKTLKELVVYEALYKNEVSKIWVHSRVVINCPSSNFPLSLQMSMSQYLLLLRASAVPELNPQYLRDF